MHRGSGGSRLADIYFSSSDVFQAGPEKVFGVASSSGRWSCSQHAEGCFDSVSMLIMMMIRLCLSLLQKMLIFQQSKRITALQALGDPYFDGFQLPSEIATSSLTPSSSAKSPSLSQSSEHPSSQSSSFSSGINSPKASFDEATEWEKSQKFLTRKIDGPLVIRLPRFYCFWCLFSWIEICFAYFRIQVLFMCAYIIWCCFGRDAYVNCEFFLFQQ